MLNSYPSLLPPLKFNEFLLKKGARVIPNILLLVIPEPVAGILPHEGSLFRPNSVETWRDVQIYENLTSKQRKDVVKILEAYSDVLSGTPSRTTATIHDIDIGDAEPIRSTPYKVPQRL